MLGSTQAMLLLTIMEIVGPVLLLAVSDLRYAAVVAPKARANTGGPGEASTRELYREDARAEKREEAGKAPAHENRASRAPRVR